MDKKAQQLGMNPGTARHRLIRDLLFSYVKDVPCFHCGKPLTRDTFSIEHKTPWLDSDDPLGLFFDLDNISYSHESCNYGAARQVNAPSACGTEGRYNKGCRCDPCKAAKAARMKRGYTTEGRRERYAKYGC